MLVEEIGHGNLNGVQRLLGQALEIHRSSERDAILGVLAKATKLRSPSAIADLTKHSSAAVNAVLAEAALMLGTSALVIEVGQPMHHSRPIRRTSRQDQSFTYFLMSIWSSEAA